MKIFSIGFQVSLRLQVRLPFNSTEKRATHTGTQPDLSPSTNQKGPVV